MVKAGGAAVAGVVPADVLVAEVNPVVVVAVVIAKVMAEVAEVIDVAAVAVALGRRKCKASSPAQWTTAIAPAVRTPATSVVVELQFPASICIPSRSQSARR